MGRSFEIFVLILNLMQYEGRTLVACPRRNQYIQVQADGTPKCVPCEPCPKGKQRKQCLLWQGRECEPCPDDSFSDEIGNKCKKCSKCQPGYFIYRPCTITEDAVCSKCPKGTYSSSVNARFCDVCIHCKPHEIQIRSCTSTSNFNCGDCMQEYYRDSATGNCLPCSQCRGNNSIVVPECYRKNQGYSDNNCMLSNGGREFSENEVPEINSPEKSGTDTEIWLTFFLYVVLLSSVVITSAFLFILWSENVQRFIRKVRDMSLCNGQKHSMDSLHIDQEEKNPITNSLLKKAIFAIWNFWKIRKSGEPADVYLKVETKSCCLNNKLVILDTIDHEFCETANNRDSKISDNQIINKDYYDYQNSWKEKYGESIDINMYNSCESYRETSKSDETNPREDVETNDLNSGNDSNNDMTDDSDNTCRSFPRRHSPRKKRKKSRRESLGFIFCKQKHTHFTTYSTL